MTSTGSFIEKEPLIPRWCIAKSQQIWGNQDINPSSQIALWNAFWDLTRTNAMEQQLMFD